MNPPSRLSVPNIEGFLCYKPQMKGSCFDVWVWKPDAEISSVLRVCVAREARDGVKMGLLYSSEKTSLQR